MQRTPPETTALARTLRTNATNAERTLWHALRTHRPRFTRQLPVGRYVIDLACRSAHLGIELDGGHHGEQVDRDDDRTRCLEQAGWTILRFWNNDVLANTAGVVRAIEEELARLKTTISPP